MVDAALLVIVPSRGRPENIARLLHAWRETEARASLCVAVDDDDPSLPRYLQLQLLPGSFLLEIGPRQSLSGWLNSIAEYYATEFDALGFMGDDHVPRTPHWDDRLCDSLDPRPALAYGDDLLQRSALPTACFLTSDIVRALGYMVPPELRHMYLDNTWLEWGRALGRITYRPDVVIEHMHPLAGKVDTDALYAESAAAMEPDAEAFAAYMAARFHEDVRQLVALV